jgi:hypothetical protein
MLPWEAFPRLLLLVRTIIVICLLPERWAQNAKTIALYITKKWEVKRKNAGK